MAAFSVKPQNASSVIGMSARVYTSIKAAYALEGIDPQSPALAGKTVVICGFGFREEGRFQRDQSLAAVQVSGLLTGQSKKR